MKTYKQRKDAARDAAIELQSKLSNDKMSWQEATEICTALNKCGKRYGLNFNSNLWLHSYFVLFVYNTTGVI